MQLVLAVAVALLVWPIFTLGLTYLAREAKILRAPRSAVVRLAAKIGKRTGNLVVDLLSCGACTSVWTGMLAYVVLVLVIATAIDVSFANRAWVWWSTPIAGACGAGIFSVLTRLSPASAVDRFLKSAGTVETEENTHG